MLSDADWRGVYHCSFALESRADSHYNVIICLHTCLPQGTDLLPMRDGVTFITVL